jgi:multicomponent Na+:H+ antiporter subunit D
VTPADAALLAVTLPLVGAVLIALLGRWPNLREAVTLATAIALFVVVLSMLPEVRAGARPERAVIDLFADVPIKFAVEPLGMLFGLVASGLWIVTSLYSIGYMRANNEHKQTRYYVCFAIALSSAMGVAFAGNMLTLFIFYEVLTLSTYPLVIHHETPEAIRAGRTYLGLLLGSSIALQLLAIMWTWNLTGTLDFTPGGILAGRADGPLVGLLLFLYMFGIGKAALMPIHRWLPAAMVAPTPVSALLHAVAVVKAGVFTAMKVIVYIFGIDVLHATGSSEWLMYVAAATLIIASLVALTKDNLKARLAYSTVSQLAYVVLGGALANGWGVIGGSMHIAMHAFGKITLFFCAGAIYTAAHKTEISDMGGIGRTMPVTMFAFLVGALSVIGLPPMGGAWSKWYLMLGAAEADQLIFVAVLMLSSLLNVAYFVPIVARAYFMPAPEVDLAVARPVGAAAAPAPEPGNAIREAPLFCLVPLCVTAAGCVALFFFADAIYDLLAPIARP